MLELGFSLVSRRPGVGGAGCPFGVSGAAGSLWATSTRSRWSFHRSHESRLWRLRTRAAEAGSEKVTNATMVCVDLEVLELRRATFRTTPNLLKRDATVSRAVPRGIPRAAMVWGGY